MSNYTTEDHEIRVSSEKCAAILDSLKELNNEHLGSVLNMALVEIYERDLSLDFIEGSLSNMANWALGRKTKE